MKFNSTGDSLVVQWLGLGAFTAGAWVQSLVREQRSCKPHNVAKKKKKYRKVTWPWWVKAYFFNQSSHMWHWQYSYFHGFLGRCHDFFFSGPLPDLWKRSSTQAFLKWQMINDLIYWNGNEEQRHYGYRVSFWGDENFLELDSGDGFTALWMY